MAKVNFKLVQAISNLRVNSTATFLYTRGGCYNFALALKQLMGKGEVVHSIKEGHAYYKLDNVYYDIRGYRLKISDEGNDEVELAKCRADRWCSRLEDINAYEVAVETSGISFTARLSGSNSTDKLVSLLKQSRDVGLITSKDNSTGEVKHFTIRGRSAMEKLFSLTDESPLLDGDKFIINLIRKSDIKDEVFSFLGSDDLVVLSLDKNINEPIKSDELKGFKLIQDNLIVDNINLGKIFIGQVKGDKVLAVEWDDKGVYFFKPKSSISNSNSELSLKDKTNINKELTYNNNTVDNHSTNNDNLKLARILFSDNPDSSLSVLDYAGNLLGLDLDRLKVKLVHNPNSHNHLDYDSVSSVSDYTRSHQVSIRKVGTLSISNDNKYLGLFLNGRDWYVWRVITGSVNMSRSPSSIIESLNKSIISLFEAKIDPNFKSFKQILSESKLSKVLDEVKSNSKYSFFVPSKVALSKDGVKVNDKGDLTNMVGQWYDTAEDLLTELRLPKDFNHKDWKTVSIDSKYIVFGDKLVVWIKRNDTDEVYQFNMK